MPSAHQSEPPDSDPQNGKPLDERVVTGVVLFAIAVIVGVIVFCTVQERRAAGRDRVRRQIEFVQAPGTTAWGRPRQLIDFQLTNSAGQTVSRAHVAGRWLVVNFVFAVARSVACR